MKISADFVTNSSSESFGTVIGDSILTILFGIPFITATMGTGEGTGEVTETGSSPDPYLPQPSTDPEDPPGTMIQANPDGTRTKTLPDGTVATKYGDGTIYATFPDGSVGVVYPDGTEKYTYGDGSTEQIAPDGTSVTNDPSGNVITIRPDGVKSVLQPDGYTTTVYPDDHYEVKDPEGTTKTYDKDNNIQSIGTSDGTFVQKNPDGTLSGTMVTPDGQKWDVKTNAEGDYITTDGKGTSATFDENGELVSGEIITEDGKLTLGENGSLSYNGKNNAGNQSQFEMKPDGSVSYTDAAGNKFEITKEGELSGTFKDNEGTLTINPDGSREAINNDGSRDKMTIGEDDSITITHITPEGEQSTIHMDPKENVTLTGPTGDKATFGKDGSLTVQKSGGESETYSPEQVKQMVEQTQKTVSGNPGQTSPGNQ